MTKSESKKSPAKVQSPVHKSPVKESKRDSERLTYGQMVTQLYVDDFNKQKKQREHGVTYQMVWKAMQAKFPNAVKTQFLTRLKQMAGKQTKQGQLIKMDKGRYKFEACQLFKPKTKPISKPDNKIAHPQKKLKPLQKLNKDVDQLKQQKNKQPPKKAKAKAPAKKEEPVPKSKAAAKSKDAKKGPAKKPIQPAKVAKPAAKKKQSPKATKAIKKNKK